MLILSFIVLFILSMFRCPCWHQQELLSCWFCPSFCPCSGALTDIGRGYHHADFGLHCSLHSVHVQVPSLTSAGAIIMLILLFILFIPQCLLLALLFTFFFDKFETAQAVLPNIFSMVCAHFDLKWTVWALWMHERLCVPFKMWESMNMWFICLLKMYAYHLNVREREYVFYLSVEAVCIPFKCERAWICILSVCWSCMHTI